MSSLLFLNAIVAITVSVASELEETAGVSDAGSTASKLVEYCNGETFNAVCLKNEVVVIQEARYGRMKLGRCLRDEGQRLMTSLNDPQVLGCYVDVVEILDAKCSGFNSCNIRAADLEYRVANPCWSALKRYLEVSYECLHVVEPDRSCLVSVTSSAQHLMTSHSSSTKPSCGSRHQPWKLEAPAGQQINVSLLDFSTKSPDQFSTCVTYGYILDSAAKKNVSICNLQIERNKLIYVAASNVLQVVINQDHNESTASERRFLLGMQAVGCSDVLAPVDSWMRRMEDEAVVGCYTSRQTWRLRCVNNQWVGVIGNCTRETGDANYSDPALDSASKADSIKGNQVVVIAFIIVLTVIICSVIICLGFVCIKRYQAMGIWKHHQVTMKSTDTRLSKHLLNGITGSAASDPILVQHC